MTGDTEDEPEDEPVVAAKPVQAAASTGIVAELEARLGMYKKALEAAKASGEAAKIRRYDRQFKVGYFIYRRRHFMIMRTVI